MPSAAPAALRVARCSGARALAVRARPLPAAAQLRPPRRRAVGAAVAVTAPTLALTGQRPRAQAVLAKKRGMSAGVVAMAVDRANKAGGKSLKKMAKCARCCVA